jgi:hypothetical protein
VGTSRNVGSPSIPPWKPALAVIGRTDVSAGRQLREVWLAAYGERGTRLVDDFAQSALATACELAVRATDVPTALRVYDATNQDEGRAGLAVELGKRALAKAVSRQSGTSGFAAELFAEATGYYVSRDLASFVASQGRVRTTSEAIRLKDDLRELTRKVVSSAGRPPVDPEGWGRYVQSVIRALRQET